MIVHLVARYLSKGKTVTFNEKGELTCGTVKEDVVLLIREKNHKIYIYKMP